MGNYYDCRLTLAPAVDPVCCPSGYLFSREAILENILSQKKSNKRKMAAWMAQEEQSKREKEDSAAVDAEVSRLAFDKRNNEGASDDTIKHIKETVGIQAKALVHEKKTVSNVVNIRENQERINSLKAFWVPSQAPESLNKLKKPEMRTICPASGKPIKMKDLVTVKFKKAPHGGQHEYVDPVTGDSFTNASRLLVIKPTGDVILEDTWKKIIRGEGEINGVKVADEDVLELQRGGTGFAEHNKKGVQAAKYFALGQGNGQADVRGQGSSGGSRFGLSFLN